MSIAAAIVAFLSLLARLAPHIPTFVRWGDDLKRAWDEAREAKAEQARLASLAAIDARRRNELAAIDADMIAAEKERDRRAKARAAEFIAQADAAAQKAIDDAAAERARVQSELADAPPKP